MSTDSRMRELERTNAADPNPENEERLALARCKAGEHAWSPWRCVEAWDGDTPLAVGGRLGHVRLEEGQRCVLWRVCFWCFAQDHKRIQGEAAKPEPLGQIHVSGTIQGRRMQHGHPAADSMLVVEQFAGALTKSPSWTQLYRLAGHYHSVSALLEVTGEGVVQLVGEDGEVLAEQEGRSLDQHTISLGCAEAINPRVRFRALAYPPTDDKQRHHATREEWWAAVNAGHLPATLTRPRSRTPNDPEGRLEHGWQLRPL